MLDLEIIRQYFDVILKGFGLTLAICGLAFLLACAIGVVVGLALLSRYAAARWAATAYVEVVRNIPFAVQVFVVFYTLPFFGIRLPAFEFGVVALAVYVGSYYAELIRSAILSVPRGQYESARGVGMSHLQAMSRVVFPQMMGFLIPPGTNQTLTLVKESSVLSIITVPELTMAALTVTGITYSPFEVFLMIALLYWATTLVLTLAGQRLERVLQRYQHEVSRAPLTVGSARP